MKKGKNRIVVMGGSFNPPTTAHYKLMKEAVDAQEAGRAVRAAVGAVRKRTSCHEGDGIGRRCWQRSQKTISGKVGNANAMTANLSEDA